MHDFDQLFMSRAIQLAHHGLGSVSPNPLVGCVIVHHDEIIGEGWHRHYGEAHAEVNAINQVKDHSLLKTSTVYVTLEPCAHHGKTPPCADLLIQKGVKRVVIACKDPFDQVNGIGIKKLITAGIEVEVNVMEKESMEMNIRFLTSIVKNRPYIILKWAQTADNFIARENFDSKWISNKYSRKLVHQWRAHEDAILVGKNTALNDNPKLNVRDWTGQDPIRLVINMDLQLDQSLHLFDQTIKTIVYNSQRSETLRNLELVEVTPDNLLYDILDDLHSRNVQSLIVEGGSRTLQQFIDLELWDEARIFTSNVRFKSGISSPRITGHQIRQTQVMGDLLTIVRNNY